MRNIFRYSLTEEDYLSFEKMQLKRRVVLSTIVMTVCFLAIGFYNYIASKNPSILIGSIIAAVIALLTFAVLYITTVKRRVKRYIFMDSSYLGENEIIIDNNAIEIKNIPKENEAGIISIYPYKIMRAIVENNDYFYFYIGMEAKILPKRSIPNEMKQQIFSNIKNNKNYVYIK